MPNQCIDYIKLILPEELQLQENIGLNFPIYNKPERFFGERDFCISRLGNRAEHQTLLTEARMKLNK